MRFSPFLGVVFAGLAARAMLKESPQAHEVTPTTAPTANGQRSKGYKPRMTLRKQPKDAEGHAISTLAREKRDRKNAKRLVAHNKDEAAKARSLAVLKGGA